MLCECMLEPDKHAWSLQTLYLAYGDFASEPLVSRLGCVVQRTSPGVLAALDRLRNIRDLGLSSYVFHLGLSSTARPVPFRRDV